MPMAASAFSSISVARGWVEIFFATSAAVAPIAHGRKDVEFEGRQQRAALHVAAQGLVQVIGQDAGRRPWPVAPP